MAGVTLVLKTKELSQRIKVEIFLLTHCTLAIFWYYSFHRNWNNVAMVL